MLEVKKDLELDINKFNYFLLNGKKSLRNMIARAHNGLRKAKTKDDVEVYVRKIYKDYEDKIDATTEEIRKIVKELDEDVWKAMESLLNEKFDGKYKIIPTMLPMSPYGRDYFNISILHNVTNDVPKTQFGVMRLCTHELSHLLYYKKMERLFSSDKDNLHKAMGVSSQSLDGLKEIYAPIIQNHPSMRKHIPNHTVGNEEFTQIKVRYQGHVMCIEDYFIEKYTDLENEGLERDEIDKKMIDLLKDIDAEFTEKLDMYNSGDRKSLTGKGYFNPIEIR